MKYTLIILLSLFAFSILPQDKFYTKGLANGYAWTAPSSASKVAYANGESLYSMLLYKKHKTDIQRELSFPLDCTDDVDRLLERNSTTTIELELVEKMIDKFYESKNNLIIPVLGAYCFCVKQLAGISNEELAEYKTKLVEFSTTELKK